MDAGTVVAMQAGKQPLAAMKHPSAPLAVLRLACSHAILEPKTGRCAGVDGLSSHGFMALLASQIDERKSNEYSRSYRHGYFKVGVPASRC
jgi:hypothetical protein